MINCMLSNQNLESSMIRYADDLVINNQIEGRDRKGYEYCKRQVEEKLPKCLNDKT